jgi:magnesium-transporting ATPase (P-type)
LKNHITGENEEWELLRTFEFTSERKAMSVIVRDKKTKRVFAHVKGADSSILPKVTHGRGESSISKFTM